jgi:PAS domain S-box-containing protein
LLIETNYSPWLITSLVNVGIGALFLLAYSIFRVELRIERRAAVQVLEGILFGACALLSMRLAVVLVHGNRVDARTVFVLMAGMFGGPTGAAVAGGAAIVYRLILGGFDTVSGVAAIVASGAFGVALAWRLGSRVRELRMRDLYLIGLVNTALIVAAAQTALWLGGDPTFPLGGIAIGFVLFPIGVLLMGTAMGVTDFRIWRRTQRRLSDFVEVSTDLVWEQDSQGRWTYLSERYRDILGGDPAEQIGKTVAASGARWLDAENEQAARAAHEARLPYSGLIGQAPSQDGTYRTLLLNARPIFDERGRFLGYRGTAHDITEQQQAREAVRESRDYLARAQKIGKIGSITFDLSTGKSTWSDQQYRLLGLDVAPGGGTLDLLLSRVHPDDRATLTAERARNVRGEEPRKYEYRIVLPSGETRWVGREAEVERDATGKVLRVLSTHQDITEQKRSEENRIALERQLGQAQKMEAIGQLTGGVAHDFNNLLGVILGRLEVLERELAGNATQRDWVRLAIKTVERGATLTKNMLAFSRQQALVPAVLDMREIIADTEGMLRHALGKAFELELAVAPNVWRVEADPGQLQSALLNLVFNSRDAMPNSGKVTISVANLTLGGDRPGSLSELPPGDYVVIAVSDTGVGMPRETVERAFQPFYTTKDVGKGTGLGLSMVYGFVKQTGGHVAIDSDPGRGTTVRLYLSRRIVGASDLPPPSAEQASAPGGNETILVVEDDDEMRILTRQQLERLGYTVLEATHGAEGLRVLDENPGIDLLLTDVVMPLGMSGLELADRAISARPNLRVVLMSGYSELRDTLERKQGLGEFQLLQKPFRVTELATRIRAALD